MVIPVLNGRENFDTFSKQMRVYGMLHGFDTIFDSEPYVEVGNHGNDRKSIMAQGVSASIYERQLMARVFVSQALQTNVDKAKFNRSTSPRKC